MVRTQAGSYASGMTRLALPALLVASAAWAQPGVWTGYVNGWVPAARPAVSPIRIDTPSLLPPAQERERRAFVYGQVLAQQQLFLAHQVLTLQAQQREQARERETEALAAEQRRLEQQQVVLQQQQAAQAQLIAEQQQLALQREQLRVEQERREVEAARARFAEEQARARAAEEEKRRAAAAVVQPEPKRDDTPGNPIHKWVDAEGVIHYSTRPPR